MQHYDPEDDGESEDNHTYIQMNGSAERTIKSSTESDELKHSSESEVDSDRLHGSVYAISSKTNKVTTFWSPLVFFNVIAWLHAFLGEIDLKFVVVIDTGWQEINS